MAKDHFITILSGKSLSCDFFLTPQVRSIVIKTSLRILFMTMKRSTELARIIWKPETKSTGGDGNGNGGDWRALGRHVRKVPQGQWEPNMLFFGTSDEIFKKYTRKFPATKVSGRTNPLFVLKVQGKQGHRVSPCSTKFNRKRDYIHKGCTLEPTKKVLSRKTYILKHLSFFLPLGQNWTSKLDFMGQVPQQCIRRRNGQP